MSRAGGIVDLAVADQKPLQKEVRTSHGQQVYRSLDASGVVTYSNVPTRNRSGTTAHLPEITKGNFERSASLSKVKNCDPHGGLDCPAGADHDGSVICKDGTRDAVAVYRFTCPTPRLEVVEVLQTGGSASLTVIVRNARSVEATNLVIKLRTLQGDALPLKGPQTLEGDSMGVFQVYVPKGVLPGGSQAPTRNQLLVTCGNCG